MPKKKKNRAEISMPVSVALPNNISADEMKHIIADGLMEFEERKKQQEKEEKVQRHKEWQRAVGVKDFSKVKKPLRWWLQFWNGVKIVFKICFISEKHIKGDGVTFGIMQMALAVFFGILNMILFLLSVILILVAPILYFVSDLLPVPGKAVAMGFAFGLWALILSRVFRIVSFEIMNMEDRNYLFGIFTCVASIISAVVAVATFFVAQG